MNYTSVVMDTFAVWLLRHRKQLDLKQSDVAKRARISISYVSTLEREQPHSITGEKITPEREKVIAIAKAVNGDANEALRLCGYASENESIPQPIREALAGGQFDETDIREIAEFIRFRIMRKSQGLQAAQIVWVKDLGEMTDGEIGETQKKAA